MKYVITELDKMTLLQKELNYEYRLLVKKGKVTMDSLTGIQSIGNYSIDADSPVRRTTAFTMLLPEDYINSGIEQKINSWIGYDFVLQIGIYNIREDRYIWYDCGTYTITSANTSYNATDNSLSFDLSDWYAKLNGDRNGQMTGIATIEIPMEDEDGNPVTIQQAAIEVIKDAGIKDYIVDNIGEFYGMPQYNPDYESYRATNPKWNHIPYTLEFSGGCHVSEILDKLKLYPNTQIYFDIYNNLCFDMIPSCNNDPIVLDNAYLQKIILAENSESVTYDIASIKNITEVYGKSFEVERYCEESTTSGNTYKLTLDQFTSYANGQIISFVPSENNVENMQFQVNDLATLPLYHEFKNEYVSVGELEAGRRYCVQIGYTDTYVAYFLGQYQPHGLCFLTNSASDPTYTAEYFAQKYNCDIKNVSVREEPENPFAVQKIGEVFETKQGEEFDVILSDSVAVANAIYYNQKSSTVQDVVTITTHMIPWLDVHQKVTYQKQQDIEPHQYIIKNITNDLDSCTSSITLYRFYPLYE